jgi:hypothetical protein
MKTRRLITSVFLASVLLAGAATVAAQEDTTATIAFSDPNKPGTLRVELMMADIRITGADTKEVSVRADIPLDDGKSKRKNGLRSLGGGSSYRISEKDNVVTLHSGDFPHAHGMADLNITVPHNTNIVLSVMHGGDTRVSGVSGNVEISNQNGDMRLENLSGGVAADTMNGGISATFAKLSEGNAYSFASMNGEITIRVPETTKASVRFRAQVGEILTDFDESQLVTKQEGTVVVGDVNIPNPTPAPAPKVEATVSPKVEVSVNGVRVTTPRAPKPPKPPFPSPGGQVVTGTLNGGGPEIIATTMRGTITFRKAN